MQMAAASNYEIPSQEYTILISNHYTIKHTSVNTLSMLMYLLLYYLVHHLIIFVLVTFLTTLSAPEMWQK